MLLVFLLACQPMAPVTTPSPAPAVVAPEPTPDPYDVARRRLDDDRRALALRPRSEARAAARARLLEGIDDDLVPAWFGTPWAFYGTSTVPGQGEIACGYFVSTVLGHAGLQVERVRMAQQPSEYIVKTFSPESELRRFRRKDAATVVRWVRSQPEGVYVVGLDYHVGMLVHREGEVRFCHSAFTTPNAVTCSDPHTDPGFVSSYRIVGPVLTDGVVDAWLDGEALPTYQPP